MRLGSGGVVAVAAANSVAILTPSLELPCATGVALKKKIIYIYIYIHTHTHTHTNVF